MEMQRTSKVHQEVMYYMGLYHQVVPMEKQQGTQFLDRHFNHLFNSQLHSGKFPIPMDSL